MQRSGIPLRYFYVYHWCYDTAFINTTNDLPISRPFYSTNYNGKLQEVTKS